MEGVIHFYKAIFNLLAEPQISWDNMANNMGNMGNIAVSLVIQLDIVI